MPHYIKPVIMGRGMNAEIIPFFECTEPDTAMCRQWCKNECEEHPRIDEYGEELECEMHPLGYCYQTKNIEADPSLWLELYWGDESQVSVRPGEIEYGWDGDGYRWKYSENSWEWAYTNETVFNTSAPIVWETRTRSDAVTIEVTDEETKPELKYFAVKREAPGKWKKATS